MSKKIPMSFREFEKYMNEIKKVYDYEQSLNDFIHNNVGGGCIIQPDCLDVAIELLSFIFNDKSDWVEYYVFDLEMGKKWKPGTIMRKDGRDVRLVSFEDLYNLLTEYDE